MGESGDTWSILIYGPKDRRRGFCEGVQAMDSVRIRAESLFTMPDNIFLVQNPVFLKKSEVTHN